VSALSTTGYGAVAWEQLGDRSAVDQLAELKTQLPLLAGRDIALVLHWPSESVDLQERWEVVEEALRLGIRVVPWLTLPDQAGYFPNATNVDEWRGNAQYLMFLWRSRGLPPTAFSVDMEMSKDKLGRFQDLTASGNLVAVADLLTSNIDRAQFEYARNSFAEFVSYAHELGFGAEATALLPLIDDYEDGDDYLRQGFNCPLDGIPWDKLEFQIHRTIYQRLYPLTSYTVYNYGQLIKKHFPDHSAIGIGVTHQGIGTVETIPVYQSGDELRADTEAALAAGFSPNDIGVYSFLGMYSREGDWFQTPRTTQAPPPDLGTGPMHLSIQALDSLGR
jgi:hypothetical protein